MPLSGIERLLWLASTAGNIALLAQLLMRRRVLSLPLFTAFTASNVLRTAALFWLYRKKLYSAYFYAYWSLAIVDLVLQLAVIYEVASKVFRPAGRWARDMKIRLLLLSVGGVVLAVALTALASGVQAQRIEIVVAKGSFFAAVLMAELFVGMVVLSVAAGLPWRGNIATVAYGFGVYSLIDVLVEAGHNVFGKEYTFSLDVNLANARALAYVCCLAYWVCALRMRAPVLTPAAEAASAAVLWNRALLPKKWKES